MPDQFYAFESIEDNSFVPAILPALAFEVRTECCLKRMKDWRDRLETIWHRSLGLVCLIGLAAWFLLLWLMFGDVL